MDVVYGLLGDLEVRRDGMLLELPGGPTRMLLAGLLINANRPVAKADLIRVAWDNSAAEVQEAQLHKRVMALRALLNSIGRRDDIRTHPRFGYELRAAEDDVDSLLFLRYIREADEAAASGDRGAEADCLHRALALWRGPRPLANAWNEALRQDISALEQRRKRTAVRLFGLELGRGNAEAVLDEAARVAALYPTDPKLCEQLMAAQYRCGHPADAGAAFERYRDAVEAEHAQPDPLLRNWYFAIGFGDETAIAAAEAALAGRSAGPPAPRPASGPRQLPPPRHLVGRGGLVTEASRRLRDDHALIVISGPGGVGKTALALRAAHDSAGRFPDGQLFMELQGSSGSPVDPSEVLAQFLRALGAPQIPETRSERLATYRTLLAGRRVLIVLDDAADGAQVTDLVPGSPQCAVVVTARRRLPRLEGAHHMTALAPLEAADAGRLFLRVISDSGISLESDPEALDRVVALCGGFPLAVRIAAAIRVHDHPRPTAELARRLDRLGPEALEHEELSVARTIGAGLERLDADARRLFLALGELQLVRFGTWTATALLGFDGGSDGGSAGGSDSGSDGGSAGRVLSRLAASFMIDPAETETRYRFHDLTRDYARRRALAEGIADLAAVPGRAYRALLTLTRLAHANLYGGDFEVVRSTVPDLDLPPSVLAEVDAAPLDWFEQERLNIRAAVEHCAQLGLTEMCWDLAVSAHEFYAVRGYVDDWHATHQVALRACRDAGNRRGEGIVLACLHQPTLVASRRTTASASGDLPDLERAVGLLRECGDGHGLAIAVRTLASALRRTGHSARSLQLFTESLEHYTANGDVVGRQQALRCVGQSHLDGGRHAAARAALQAAEAVAAELGDARLIAQTRYWIGQAALAADDVAGARAAFTAVFDEYGDAQGLGRAYALHGLGDLAVRDGFHAAAEQHLTTAAAVAADASDALLEGRVWLSVAALRQAQGRTGPRVAALQRAQLLFAGCGAAYLEVRALAGLADADPSTADDMWDRIDGIYDAAGVRADERIKRPRPVQDGMPVRSSGG